MTPYHRTQPGTTILVVLFFAIIAVLGILVGMPNTTRRMAAPILLITAAALVVVSILFASLTITVDANTLAWRFGPGIIRKSVSVKDIAHTKPVRIDWISGWGIHLTRDGWLYNVSGRDAVKITLHDRRTFLLGTDDPAGLTASLNSAAGR